MLSIGWTTTADKSQAIALANALVEPGLVACAQIDGPITSIYRWEGRTAQDPEFRIWLKFKTELAEQLESQLRKLHPYENPQWIVVKADHVAEKYLSWAKANSSSLPFNASQASL